MTITGKTRVKRREAILTYLNEAQGFMPARDIAIALHLPYKTVIDALDALHGQGRVARRGRKCKAAWGSSRNTDDSCVNTGWAALATTWFGK
jgi:predicted ArsR family transcriptional regulator